VVNDREDRAAAVVARPALGRVGRPQLVGRVGRDPAGVQALGALAHVRRGRQQPGLAHQPQHALAARADAAQPQPCGDLLVTLADERRFGDLPADRCQQVLRRYLELALSFMARRAV